MDAILGIDTNEKMDVIGHGLEFSQFGPSKDAHLGNDFLEPSVAILLSMLAVVSIVGDDRSAVPRSPHDVIGTELDNVIGFDLYAEQYTAMCYPANMRSFTVRYNYRLRISADAESRLQATFVDAEN
jgi:hypothetical protein